MKWLCGSESWVSQLLFNGVDLCLSRFDFGVQMCGVYNCDLHG